MRLLLASLAVLASSVLALPAQDGTANGLDRRQFGGLLGLLGGNMQAKPAKVEDLPPLIRKDATRKRLWYGPFVLPALVAGKKPESGGMKMPLQMDPDGTQIVKMLSGFCADCTVLYGKSVLSYGNGTRAESSSGVYDHHVVLVDMTKRNFPFYLCEGQQGFLGQFPGEGFIVSGNDEAANYFTTPDGKFDSGYYLGRAPILAIQGELVNYRPEPQTVYVTMEYEYLPGKAAKHDSSVSLFSVTGCNMPDYHAPKDSPQYNISSARVPVPHDGFIISAKGHLHDGGSNIVLKLNDKVVCDSKAIYGIDSRGGEAVAANGKKWQVITEMTQCTDATPVKKGDILQIDTFYDNAAHPPRMAADGHSGDSDEMGVFFLNFAIPNPVANATTGA